VPTKQRKPGNAHPRAARAEQNHIARQDASGTSPWNQGHGYESMAHQAKIRREKGDASRAEARNPRSKEAEPSEAKETPPMSFTEAELTSTINKALEAQEQQEALEAKKALDLGDSTKKSGKSDKIFQPSLNDSDGKVLKTDSAAYLSKLHTIAMQVQADLQIQTYDLAKGLKGCDASFAITKSDGPGVEPSGVGKAEVAHVNRQIKARKTAKKESTGHQTPAEKEQALMEEEEEYTIEAIGKGNFKEKQAAVKADYMKDKDKKKYMGKMTRLYGVWGKPIETKTLEDEVKGLERIADKKQKYGNDYSAFTDIARSSLIFDTPKALLDAKPDILAALTANGQEVVRQKNRFEEPTDDGYSDILLNVEDTKHGGHLFELQLHVKGLYDAKTAPLKDEALVKMLGSAEYKKVRASNDELIKAHKDELPYSTGPTTTEETFVLPPKALASAEKIRDKTNFSGHDIYNVKRFIFEQAQGKGPFKTHVVFWAEFAKEHFYQPASTKTSEEGGAVHFDALKALSFTADKKTSE
jgi:hypothetical protein